jgi:peptide/nickel transport system permease protein
MLRFIRKRLILLIPVLLGVSLVSFALLHFTPGDPARMILGPEASKETVEQYRDDHGLNDPFFVQYGRYIGKIVLHGDMGTSYMTKRPVMQEIRSYLPSTFRLALSAIIIAICVGIPLGIIAALWHNSVIDVAAMGVVLLGVSMPVFWVGLLMILFFGLHLRWFPVSGFSTLRHMVLPSLVLATQSIAVIARMTRVSMLGTIDQDYSRTAHSKGLSSLRIIFGHQIGNALIPVVTSIGLQFGHLLGGAVVTESIFSIPGIGRYIVESIKMRDYPVVQGGILVIAFSYCIVNLAVDVLYAVIDPRIRNSYRSAIGKAAGGKKGGDDGTK